MGSVHRLHMIPYDTERLRGSAHRHHMVLRAPEQAPLGA